MKMILTSVLFVALTTAALSSLAASPGGNLRFARQLLQEGDYYRSITEYKRVLFFAAPESVDLRHHAILGIGEALFAGGEYERSGEWLHSHLNELQSEDERREGVRLMSRSFLVGNAGLRLLEVIDRESLDRSDEGFYRALGLANLGRWSESAGAFDALASDRIYGAVSVNFATIARDADRSSWRSPRIAGLLGLVPGLGYLYAGHKQTAIAAVIVNAVFAGATIQAFRSEQEVLGGFLAAFTLSWYAGSIYGSVQGARRSNSHLQQEQWSRFQY